MKRKKKKRRIIIIAVLLIPILFAVFFVFISTPMIKKYCSAKVEAVTMKAINNSIISVFTEEVSYTDFVTVVYNEQNKITAINAKTAKINLLARQIASVTEKSVESLGEDGIDVPFGAFSGIDMFSGYGIPVNFRFIPVSAVNCDFVSDFKSVGVNQTLHKIYMNIYVDLQIVLPANIDKIRVSSQILVSENVLIGDIPQTYLVAEEKGDMLNLIP